MATTAKQEVLVSIAPDMFCLAQNEFRAYPVIMGTIANIPFLEVAEIFDAEEKDPWPGGFEIDFEFGEN